MSNKWEDFNIWLDENVILKQLFNCIKVNHIKNTLIITSKDLKEAIN